MEWITLAAAVVGAVIATASATLLERTRWQRERQARSAEIRRQLYGEYLAALASSRNAFRSLGRNRELPLAERAAAAREAFEPCYALRYQMSITASPPVHEASEAAFRRLRHVRNITAEGVVSGDDGYESGRAAYESALTGLRAAMRKDLGTDGADGAE
ncbi:hypothetical protein ACIBCM_18795 [Streptomyces sp. NPDC051018]|uniref:hypothetical protein n=1 Tax=Streptomyces sp. NPDC051018 TaxID=3365639 RepID=UPI0037A75D6E